MPRMPSGAPSGLASTTNADPLALDANHLNPDSRQCVTVGRGGRLERGEVRAAGPLREHLRRLAGELTGGEELPDPVTHVGRRELVGQANDHVAAGPERAHHPDLGLVEQVRPGCSHGRRVDSCLPRLLAERRGREVVLDQVTP